MGRISDTLLTRSRLRDVVILLSIGSALFYPVTVAEEVISLLLLIAGAFLHYVTKGVLIRNEVLCKEGIYSVVRHPYYMANYLVDSSFCLLSGNPYLLLLYPFLFFWCYGSTIRTEENTLTEAHGGSSMGYMLTTPQVFPDRYSIYRFGHILDGFSSKRISHKEMARIIRFFAMGLLILTIHRVTWHAFETGDLHSVMDIEVILFLLIVALLYAINLLVLATRRR